MGIIFYQNAENLFNRIEDLRDHDPLGFQVVLNARTRVWMLNPLVTGQILLALSLAMKREFIAFRSFDPSEDVRLSAQEAIDAIACSSGVVLPWLNRRIVGSVVHNARAAFCFGIARGMRKATLVISEAGEQIPLDFRDTVTQVSDPNDVRFAVARFRQTVDEKFHSAQDEEKNSSFLGGISFGSKVAENEFRDLHEYYVATDQSERTLRGEVNLVVGRKGSGKSALFFRVRDQLQRHRKFVVVALQPEGYQLQKLKERVLKYLEPGSQLQLLTAFWHYLLLSEIAIITVEQDRPLIGRNGALQVEFEACVAALEASTNWNEQADFSERLSELSERLIVGFVKANSEGMDDVKTS